VLLRPALVAATTAVLVGLPLGVAEAATYRHADPQGDVQSQATDSTTGDMSPAPDAKDPDVTRLTVAHASRKVSVRLRLRDLTRTGQVEGVVIYLRTNEHVRREVDVMAGPGMWRGQVDFSSPRRSLHCKGLTHDLDYDHNVATVSIPRSCLSRPRWVQVGVGAIKMTDTTAYADDAQSTTVGNYPVWSPRVHRG
jgi:hypothetical protein